MIYIATTFLLLMTLYAISSFFLYTLPIVEAGPIFGVKCTGLRRMPERINSSYKKVKHGVVYWYRRFFVQGECMTKVGIRPESIVSVRMIPEKEKNGLKSGDIVLIFLNDKNFRGYKIRIIKNIDGNDANTFYYDENGNERMSSKSHTLVSIIGVIDLEESKVA